MTQIARVFVVVNLLLGAGMLFSLATILGLNDHWKQQYMGEVAASKVTVAAKDLEINNLKAEGDKLSQANAGLKDSHTQLEATNSTMRQQVESLNADKHNMETANSALSERLDNLASSVDRLQKQNERAQKDAKDNADQARKARAEAVAANAARDKAKAEILALTNARSDLEKQVVSLNDVVKEKDTMIDYARHHGISFANLVVMDPVNGSVVNADVPTNLAVINVGKNDGVKKGYVFDVFRGHAYVGQITIETVYAAAAAGTISLKAPDIHMRAGDRVTTTLH